MGPLIVVTITTFVAFFTKMFDYYQDKDLRDIKMMLDFQKGLTDNKYSGKQVSEIRKITNVKIDAYIEETRKNTDFKTKHSWLHTVSSNINFLITAYLLTAFGSYVLFVILDSIYSNEDFSKLFGIALVFGLFAAFLGVIKAVARITAKINLKIKSKAEFLEL